MKQIKWLGKPWDPSQEVSHSSIVADQSHFQTLVEHTTNGKIERQTMLPKKRQGLEEATLLSFE